MAITDLTNTKWYFNEYVRTSALYPDPSNINFVSNNTNYTQMRSVDESGDMVAMFYNNDRVCYDDDMGSGPHGWTNEAYRTIEITGGADVTNSYLIEFLEGYATQIEEPSSDVIETTISVGNNLLADASVGTSKLLKAFIGSHLIFERLGGNFLTSDGKLLLTSDNKIFNVQPSGFSGNILGYGVTGNGVMTYIKFDTAPSSFGDYDARITVLGEIDGSTSYSNKSKAYVWGEAINTGKPKIKINNVETTVSESHANPTEITLDGDYDIYLGYAFGSG